MATREAPAPKRRLWAWIPIAAAGIAGFRFAYGFGQPLGGAWLGWVTGLNGALLCWVLADAVVARVERWHAGRGARPPG
jgi:hypothetical protein